MQLGAISDPNLDYYRINDIQLIHFISRCATDLNIPEPFTDIKTYRELLTILVQILAVL